MSPFNEEKSKDTGITTPSYTGGPEQIQLAGGFFDPRTQQVVYDPYGTANLYKFSKGGIANFKNYGY